MHLRALFRCHVLRCRRQPSVSVDTASGTSGEGDAARAAVTGEEDFAAKVEALMDGHGGLLAQIDALKREQTEARRVRQKIARDLRNAQRRKRRLKTKARMLTNDDLVAVLLMRREPVPESGGEAAEPFAAAADSCATASPSPKKRSKSG